MTLPAPLRLAAFRRLVAAFGVNAVGTWLGEIALSVVVLRETGSVTAVAAIFVAGQFVPALLAPALVARFESLRPERALAAALLAEAVLTTLLAAGLATGRFALAPILVVAALDGVAALAARALIKASVVATTRPRGLLREGNAILTTVFTAAFAVGPFAGGVVVAVLSPAAALALDAASFAAAAALVAVRTPAHAGAEEQSREISAAARLRSGLAHLRGRPDLRRMVAASAAVTMAASAILPLEIVLVTETLHGSEAAYGAVLGLWGVGSVLAGPALILLRRLPTEPLAACAFAVVALSYLGMGTAANVETVLLFSLVGGLANGVEAFAVMTAVQERTADSQQVRVGGLVEALMSGGMGLGFLLGGALASAASPRAAYVVAGLAILSVAAWLALRRAPARAGRLATAS